MNFHILLNEYFYSSCFDTIHVCSLLPIETQSVVRVCGASAGTSQRETFLDSNVDALFYNPSQNIKKKAVLTYRDVIHSNLSKMFMKSYQNSSKMMVSKWQLT